MADEQGKTDRPEAENQRLGPGIRLESPAGIPLTAGKIQTGGRRAKSLVVE